MNSLTKGAALGIAALLSLCSLAWSEDSVPSSQPVLPSDAPVEGPQQPPLPRRQTRSTLEFSLDVSRFDYAENVPLPLKSTETGILPGIFIQFRSQQTPDSYFWSVIGEYSPGSTHYDGSTQSGVPVQQSTSNAFLRAEANFGINLFCLSQDPATACLKPYSGLGARIWTRGISKVENGVASPSELYTWLYLPLGLRYEQQFSDNFSLALDVSFRLMFLGNIKVRFSELDSGALDSNGNLGSKPGWRVELPALYRLSSGLSLNVTPWYEYSAIGQGDDFTIITSTKSGRGYEPESRTYQYGVRAGVVLNY